MQKLEAMMTRVGRGISKEAAWNTENAWKAVLNADMSESGVVKLDPHGYACIYKYLQACAKAAGIVCLLLAMGCGVPDGYRGRVVKIEDVTSTDSLTNYRTYRYDLEVGCSTLRILHTDERLALDQVVCVAFGASGGYWQTPDKVIRCPRNLKTFPRWKPLDWRRLSLEQNRATGNYGTGIAMPRCVELPGND